MLSRGCVAALFVSAATTAFAQQAPEPEETQPATTTVEEPIAEPKEPPEDKGSGEIEHVPEDASGIDLSTLETKNFSLGGVERNLLGGITAGSHISDLQEPGNLS